jgi:hypothetical protein
MARSTSLDRSRDAQRIALHAPWDHKTVFFTMVPQHAAHKTVLFTMVLQHTVHQTVFFTMILQQVVHQTVLFTMFLQHAAATMTGRAAGATSQVPAIPPTRAAKK